MNLDLDRLEQLARECPTADEDPMLEDWYDEQHLADGIHQPADRALIAAASPDVMLALIERVRTAEATLAEAWGEGVDACARSHGHLRPMDTNPYRTEPR